MKVKTGLMAFSLVAVVLVQSGWSKTIGLLKDNRSYISEGMLKTLNEAGWQTTILQGADLADEAKLAALDVIFLPGGWNSYYFTSFESRRNLVKFVAGGKGVLAGAFRSGYVRTATRPLFPQVGATYNRVDGAFISAYGNSELAKAIEQPFTPGSWDHLVVKLGPLGKVFAINGTDPVGVYGEVYGGRYLVFGAFLGMDAGSNVMQGVQRNLLLKSMEWLAAAPKLSAADKVKQEVQADLDFLRRERVWDWTLNERGPDNGAGLIPKKLGAFQSVLESRLYTFQFASQYLSGREADLAKAEIVELQQALKELAANNTKITSDTLAAINNMSVAELVAKNYSATNEVYAKLFSEQRLVELKAKADKLLSDLKPAIKASKAAKLAAEHQSDLAQLPGIILNTVSTNVTTRREAVQELGRIGELKTADTLIKLLGDTDEKVRVGAIQALGWMQAKESVPALIKLLESKEVIMQRRAAQALGQIGDARAVKPLLAQIITDKNDFLDNYSEEKLDYKGKDYLVSESAIMSLGWLKAKEAVPVLLKILNTFDKNIVLQKGLMSISVVALGYIGDTAALPPLVELAKLNDAPVTKRGKKVTIYSSKDFLGFGVLATEAVARIKEGGRKEVGVKQPDFLSSKKKFYALTRNFNAFAGRAVSVKAGDDLTIVPAYAWEAGLTGLHNAWGEGGSDLSVDSDDTYAKMVAVASDFDLNWIDVLPMGSRAEYDLQKADGEVIFDKFQDEPALAGFWCEEEYGGVWGTAYDFDTWLDKKYGPDYRKKLGVPDNYALPFVGKDGHELADTSGLLETEYLEYCGDKILEKWRESQDWMHGRRKGFSFTHSITHRQFATFIGLTGRTSEVVDAPGPESYQSFGRDNAFVMEMFKNGEARPVMTEFYNWYSADAAHAERGYAQQLMHGECFFNFHYQQVSKTPTYYLWLWDGGRWEKMEKVFQKAAKIKEYINVPASAANVAQLCSEMTATYFHKQNKAKLSSLGSRFYQQQAGLWTALNQCQIPTDVIMAESLTAEKLQRYKVIVMTDAKMLNANQVKLLRDWVEQGGVLIASGTSSLYSRLPAIKKNYMLADVFGVNYAGFAGITDPSQIDTLGFKQGADVFKIESSMELPGVAHHIHRDIKPVKSLDKYSVLDSAYLPGITKGTACEYDMPLGYDKVVLTRAEVVAKFASGDPALTVNAFGKGLCYFWTPIYPGLCYISSDWEVDANKKDFWPNVCELLGAMVKGGLAFQKATLPVDVTEVSKEVEVTVRQQPEQNRMMVHLLDYDAKSDSVKGAKLTVHPPAGKTVKRVFYPDTDTEVKFKANASGVMAQLRDFEVHDMVVVEWQ